MAPTLETLPEELQISIVDFLEGKLEALRQLALVSSKFQVFSEAVLYRSVFLRKDAVLQNFLRAAQRYPWRSKAIHFFEARLTGDHCGSDCRSLADVLYLAPNVHELIIESPFCNQNAWQSRDAADGWDVTLQTWFAPLAVSAGLGISGQALSSPMQALKKLTLHLNGQGREFWTANATFASVFAHPTVQEMHISSVNLPDNFAAGLPVALRTPLKRLELDEVNVTQVAWHALLARPKALEYLYLGENKFSPREEAYPPGQAYNCLYEDVGNFMAALKQQQHSLKILKYAPKRGPIVNYSSEPPVGMEGFQCLQEIHLQGFCGSISSILTHPHQAPPCVSKLAVDEEAFREYFLREELTPDRGPQYIELVAEAVPSLKQMDVVCDIWRFGSYTHEWEGREETDFQRSIIVGAGEYLKRKHIALRVLRPPERFNMVRPILYGETEVDNLLVYVNDDQGFRSIPGDATPPDDEWEDASDGDDDAEFDVEIFEEVEEEDELMDDDEEDDAFDDGDVFDGFQE